jgi:hypothetical protein
VDDLAAFEGGGELAHLVDQVTPTDVRVVGEELGADGDWLEHAPESTQ